MMDLANKIEESLGLEISEIFCGYNFSKKARLYHHITVDPTTGEAGDMNLEKFVPLINRKHLRGVWVFVFDGMINIFCLDIMPKKELKKKIRIKLLYDIEMWLSRGDKFKPNIKIPMADPNCIDKAKDYISDWLIADDSEPAKNIFGKLFKRKAVCK
jgi:hypothetical protein